MYKNVSQLSSKLGRTIVPYIRPGRDYKMSLFIPNRSIISRQFGLLETIASYKTLDQFEKNYSRLEICGPKSTTAIISESGLELIMSDSMVIIGPTEVSVFSGPFNGVFKRDSVGYILEYQKKGR